MQLKLNIGFLGNKKGHPTHMHTWMFKYHTLTYNFTIKYC